MTNVSQFMSKESIQLQACEWISKIDRGLRLDERKALVQWVEISEAHRNSLFSLAKTWDDLSALNELKGLFPASSQHMTKPQRRVYSDSSRRFIAASIVCLFFTFLGLAVNHQMNIFAEPENVFTQTLTAQTSIGEHRSIVLNDGSIVHLNTDSAVRVDFTAAQRYINLQKGEAHFDVAHDATRPFIVDTGDKTVTAVGTAFSVRVTDTVQLELLVSEGKVLVKDALVEQGEMQLSNNPKSYTAEQYTQETLMEAGQKAIFHGQHTKHLELTSAQIQNELAWQQGMLVFHGELLDEALQEISRYTPVTFKITDDKVKLHKVAGYFKAGDVDGLLFALKNNFNIAYSRESNNTITLYSGL